jgi:hypothetical protein
VAALTTRPGRPARTSWPGVEVTVVVTVVGVSCCLAGEVVVQHLSWCAAAHVVGVVAAAGVVVDEPGRGFGLELADRAEPATVERGSPALLQGGALEAFADGVVVR